MNLGGGGCSEPRSCHYTPACPGEQDSVSRNNQRPKRSAPATQTLRSARFPLRRVKSKVMPGEREHTPLAKELPADTPIPPGRGFGEKQPDHLPCGWVRVWPQNTPSLHEQSSSKGRALLLAMLQTQRRPRWTGNPAWGAGELEGTHPHYLPINRK